jgi:ABC-type Fe3+/spermidine/putrescine transport system ATPase subunit
MTQVAVRNLSKRFQNVVAAHDVSFEVPRGSLLTLLGPSGSGKTTTLMMVAGFAEPDSGTIEVAGRDVTRLPPNKRGLGVVFQSYALFPHKTVAENVAFPLEIRRMKRDEVGPRVDRLLELVKLSAFREHSVTTLSGGQKQRVALARALVFEPPVLLMDEPLGALDKKLREHMQVEIKALQRSLGVTALYVTHDQDEALMMSDVIAVMNDGRIEQIGPPALLYEEPANRFVAEFLGGVNLFPARAVAVEGDACVAELDGGIRAPCHATGVAAADGAARWIGIRPERVRLVPDGAAGALFAATVLKQTYLGGTMIYDLAGETGLSFSARLPIDGPAELPAAGSRVGVTWPARSAWLLS